MFLCSWKPHLKCAHTCRLIRSHGWCYNWNTRERIINPTSYFPPLTQHELCGPLHFPSRETHCLELYTLFNYRVFMVKFSHLRGKSCLSPTARRHSKLLPQRGTWKAYGLTLRRNSPLRVQDDRSFCMADFCIFCSENPTSLSHGFCISTNVQFIARLSKCTRVKRIVVLKSM